MASKNRAGVRELIQTLENEGMVAISQDEAARRLRETADIEKVDYEIARGEFSRSGWILVPANQSTEGALYVKENFIEES